MHLYNQNKQILFAGVNYETRWRKDIKKIVLKF